MRPYRAKPIGETEFVYGYPIQKNGRVWIVTEFETPKCIKVGGHQILSTTYEVIPSTAGQSTGLKDKNGVEIYYDSDIVEYTYTVNNDYGTYEETATGTVVLDLKFTNSLCIKRKGGSMYHFTASEVRNLEIISNVHTPEEKPKK